MALAIIAAAADFATETKRLIFVLWLFFLVYVITLLAWFTASLGVITSGGFEIDRFGNKDVKMTGKE